MTINLLLEKEKIVTMLNNMSTAFTMFTDYQKYKLFEEKEVCVLIRKGFNKLYSSNKSKELKPFFKELKLYFN